MTSLRVIAVAFALSAPAAAQHTDLITVSTAAMPSIGQSAWASLSATGRYVVFASGAPDLLPGPAPAALQVYLRDRDTGSLERISSSLGAPGNEASTDPVVSADGRHVVFLSTAANLVPGMPPDIQQVLRKDRQTGAISILSVNAAGQPANASCKSPSITPDARYVAFSSGASNLGAGSGEERVYIRDVLSPGVIAVAIGSNPRMSADARYIVYESDDYTGRIFLRDRALNHTELITIHLTGEGPNGECVAPTISDDGRFVAFMSDADNLVPDPPPAAFQARHVYLRDRQSAQTILVDRPPASACRIDNAFWPAISADGSRIAYVSRTDITGCCQNGEALFVYDIATGATIRADIGPGENALGTGHSSEYYPERRPAISADARVVTFMSEMDFPYYGYNQVYARSLDECGPGAWTGPAGGWFHSGANWCDGAAPTLADRVVFTGGGSTTVAFGANPGVASLVAASGDATLELAGRTLALLGADAHTLRVGAACPDISRLTIHGGTLFARNGASVGTYYSDSPGELVVEGAAAALTVAGELLIYTNGYSGPSIVRVLNGGRIRADSAQVLYDSAIVEVTGPGSLLETAHTISSMGSVNVLNSGRIVAVQGTGDLDAILLWNGAATVSGPGSSLATGPGPEATFACAAALSIDDGALVDCGRFSASPPYNYYGGIADIRVRGAGSLLRCATTFDVGENTADTLEVADGGVVQSPVIDLGVHANVYGDDATLHGHVRNGAFLLPGDSPQAPGVGALHIDGDLTNLPFGVLFLDVGAAAGPAPGHDVIDVSGAAALSGAAVVALAPGFIPPAGASFDLLTASSIAGEFDYALLPDAVAGRYFELQTTTTAVRLVVRACPGDANGDRSVDFLDLNIVLTFYGQAVGAGTNGDLDGDGVVGFTDLNIVLSNFGAGC